MTFKTSHLLIIVSFVLIISGCASKKTETQEMPGSVRADMTKGRPLQTTGKKQGDYCLLAMVRPADGPVVSQYGNRRLGKKSKTRFHKGIDIGAKRGTSVVAAAPGRVCFVGNKRGYGKTVDVDHGDGVTTRYAHLDAIFVAEGQQVNPTCRLGLVGRTGRTTGANLHFELLDEGRHVNPLLRGTWLNETPDRERLLASSASFVVEDFTAEDDVPGGDELVAANSSAAEEASLAALRHKPRHKRRMLLLDILLDTLIDAAKMLPFLYFACLLVELAEGPRMISSLVDADPMAVEFDMRVELVCDRIGDEVVLPRFRPV